MPLKAVRVVFLSLAVLMPLACGGGGGSGSSNGDDPTDETSSEFFLEAAFIARVILGVDGDLEAVINPASLHEVDPLTGVALAGFPKPLNAGADLNDLAGLNLAQIQDPITPQVPLVPRNAAVVLKFTKDVDGTTLGLGTVGDDDNVITSSSTIQVRGKDGSVKPARAWVVDDQVVLLGIQGQNLGWEASPLVFDAQGKVVEDPDGHLNIVVGDIGVGTLSAVDGEAVGPRADLLSSLGEPFPFNPGNSQLDAIVQQTDGGIVSFNGFLPDTTAPRLVRSVEAAGSISQITSVSVGGLAAVQLEDATLVPEPNLLANAGEGEWANALLTISSGGGVTSDYVVDLNLELAGEPVFQLVAGQVLDPAVTVGDTYVVRRAEFYEPVPPPLPTDPAELARVTVDPDSVPRDPFDPQDLNNSDLRWFARVFDENGVERTDVWNPLTGLFGAVPPKSSIQLTFSEPMDVDSFRPYETFSVSSGSLARTDPAFLEMRIGQSQSVDNGRAIRFAPVLEDQLDPDDSSFIGFGGTATALRLVLRTCPDQADIDALKASATGEVLDALVDLDVTGVLGVTDLGGRGLGLPAALLDQSDVDNFMLATGSAGRGAFPPAVDFVLDFETSSSSDPDYGVIVHRFMGQASTSTFNYPDGVVHDEVTAGVEYNDYPEEDSDGDGDVDRRFIYGPELVEVGLSVPGRLTGAPANTIEHLIDEFNPPKPSGWSSPNGEDLLISLGFGLSTPINSPFGARFQHIYRGGDASPSVSDFRGVILDLVGLAWSPLLNPDGTIGNTKLDGLEILIGLSGINRGRGPNTNQTNGIPQDSDSGLRRQFDCNLLEWGDNCCETEPMVNLLPFKDDQPVQTSVVQAGTPYLIQQTSLFKPASAGQTSNFNLYHDYPKFNAGIDPFFGSDKVFSFPYDSVYPMLIEYRYLPNDEPPARNVMRFSPGILTSALPRFRIWSQGQDSLAHCVPNWTQGVGPGPYGGDNTPGKGFRGGEGGPLIEPGTLSQPILAPHSEVDPNNTMPTIPVTDYILPPQDEACTSLQPTPDFADINQGMIQGNDMAPNPGCVTQFPNCNSDPAMNWYHANGMFAYPLPNTFAYPGPNGQPPTYWRGYGLPAGAVSGAPQRDGSPCLIPFAQGFSNQFGVTSNEPAYQPGPGNWGDNSRYYMMWKYRKRVSIVESPTLSADTPSGFVRYLRPIVEPPIEEIKGPHELRVEIKAGTLLDFSISQLDSGYVDVSDPDFVNAVSGVGEDRVYVKFRTSFGVATGLVQPPALDTIIMPYEKVGP